MATCTSVEMGVVEGAAYLQICASSHICSQGSAEKGVLHLEIPLRLALRFDGNARGFPPATERDLDENVLPLWDMVLENLF